MRPRVFFGTMYSDEAEFPECIDVINSQRGLEHFLHYVVRNKPEAEAHNELWSAWEREKYRFDLFVKVDADTILGDPEAISRVWQLFEENPRVTGAQLRLHDFFTDDLIAGLNFFSPVVKFNTSPELYCDRVDTNHDVVMKGSKVKQMEPIGFHCKNPNDNQAFHFGLHRMLKGQTPTLHKVWNAYEANLEGKRARELALLGAAIAHSDPATFMGAGNTYTHEAYQQVFTSATAFNSIEIEAVLRPFVERMGWSL